MSQTKIRDRSKSTSRRSLASQQVRKRAYSATAARKKKPPTTLLPSLNQVQHWLRKRSRFLRILIAAFVATVLTGTLAIVTFGVLFSIQPSDLESGVVNADNILSLTLTVLLVIGVGLYWVGWRLLVGFDFAEKPWEPGIFAALWVYIGATTLIGVVILSILGALAALSPE